MEKARFAQGGGIADVLAWRSVATASTRVSRWQTGISEGGARGCHTIIACTRIDNVTRHPHPRLRRGLSRQRERRKSTLRAHAPD